MRRILVLLVLTSAPAFCQENSRNAQFHYNPQWIPPIFSKQPDVTKPRTVFRLQVAPAEQVCSIPLLNANPVGNPVHMPEIRMPQGAPGASGAVTEPQVFDRMAVKPPAPACPAR